MFNRSKFLLIFICSSLVRQFFYSDMSYTVIIGIGKWLGSFCRPEFLRSITPILGLESRCREFSSLVQRIYGTIHLEWLSFLVSWYLTVIRNTSWKYLSSLKSLYDHSSAFILMPSEQLGYQRRFRLAGSTTKPIG